MTLFDITISSSLVGNDPVGGTIDAEPHFSTNQVARNKSFRPEAIRNWNTFSNCRDVSKPRVFPLDELIQPLRTNRRTGSVS